MHVQEEQLQSWCILPAAGTRLRCWQLSVLSQAYSTLQFLDCIDSLASVVAHLMTLVNLSCGIQGVALNLWQSSCSSQDVAVTRLVSHMLNGMALGWQTTLGQH